MNKIENKYFIYDRPIEKEIRYLMKRTLFLFETVFYKIIFRYVKISSTIKKKYNVSICAIFKNEGTYLKEWIEYHRIVGVEHFYLYNNFSSDDYNTILSPYIENGIVTLIEWEVHQGQISAYNDCIKKYRDTSKWIGFFDLDEFIVPNYNNTVYEFLKEFEQKYPVVLLYWKFFGSSGRIIRDTNNLITEDFTISWKKYVDVGKCFYNTNFDYDPDFKHNKIMNHYMWGNYKGIPLPPINVFSKICIRGFNPFNHNINFDDSPIQVNHYFTKSYNEYLEKISRGDAFFIENPRNDNYFYDHEMKCQSVDFHIYKYLIKLKKALTIKN